MVTFDNQVTSFSVSKDNFLWFGWQFLWRISWTHVALHLDQFHLFSLFLDEQLQETGGGREVTRSRVPLVGIKLLLRTPYMLYQLSHQGTPTLRAACLLVGNGAKWSHFPDSPPLCNPHVIGISINCHCFHNILFLLIYLFNWYFTWLFVKKMSCISQWQ